MKGSSCSWKAKIGRVLGMLCRLLGDRHAESLVEVLVAGMVFIILMGTLRAGVQFASGALRKAQAIRDDAFQFQQSVRQNLVEQKITVIGTGSVRFGGGSFSVPVGFGTVQGTALENVSGNLPDERQADNAKTAAFYFFAAQEPREEGDGT